MKVFIILCFVYAVYAETVELTTQQKEIAKKNAGDCIKETGVNKELLSEAQNGNFKDDEGLNKFLYCFFRKAGIVNEDGKLNLEIAVSKLPPGIDKARAEQAMNDCKNEVGKDPADTAAKILRCYHANSKQHILLKF